MSRRRLPSLSALRAFEAAARHESAKQAAEELSVTATAISHLEETLGVALFLRKPRQLELTAAGRELQQVLESAFDSIGAAVERLSAVLVERNGPVGKASLHMRTPEGWSRRQLFDATPPVLDELRPEPAFSL